MKRSAVRVTDEVTAAIADKRPIVALESSVWAHGLPAPHNLEAARACCQAVRDEGAEPAIVAVIGGEPILGIETAELERLVDPARAAMKIGARDFAVAAAFGRWGATTVSATCAVADAVGVRLFATGGIGGVHREAERTFDVSQDLAAIARARVAVVCAGAKAVLDLPRTLEALEALGVPVVGLGTSELPAFYANRSGLELEQVVPGPSEAAALLYARWETLGEGGVVLANPVPREAELDPGELGRVIERALAIARVKGISGKTLTPFLLAEVAELTAGRSLATNVAVLVANARAAARVAVAYAALEAA